MLTPKQFAKLVGISEQTIRNLDAQDVLKPIEVNDKGYRKYEDSQVYDYYRYANKLAIEKRGEKILVLLYKDTIDYVLLHKYLSLVFKNYEIKILRYSSAIQTLNDILSLGVIDSLIYLDRTDDILRDYDLLFKRLGINKVFINSSRLTEFSDFRSNYIKLRLCKLFLEQLNSLSITLDFDLNLVQKYIFSTVCYIQENTNYLADDCSEVLGNYKKTDLNFVLDIIFSGDKCGLKTDSSELQEFMTIYKALKLNELGISEILTLNEKDSMKRRLLYD